MNCLFFPTHNKTSPKLSCLTNRNRMGFIGRGALKRQEMKPSLSDRGWKEELQQWTVWGKLCVRACSPFQVISQIKVMNLSFNLIDFQSMNVLIHCFSSCRALQPSSVFASNMPRQMESDLRLTDSPPSVETCSVTSASEPNGRKSPEVKDSGKSSRWRSYKRAKVNLCATDYLIRFQQKCVHPAGPRSAATCWSLILKGQKALSIILHSSCIVK